MSEDASAEPAVVAISVADVEVPGDIEVSPAASPEELSAILAAYDALWSDPSPGASAPVLSDWRFAGRWWMGVGPRAALPARNRPTA